MVTEAEKPLVAIVGPTAAGKSDLALFLAEKFGGEIVSCDSLQVYRGFDIGTAKVPALERRGIPHHLIDVAEATQVFTAGDFAAAASTAIRGISRRGRLPVITGGTGFYLRSLLEGMTDAPPRNERLRARLAALEARTPGCLHRVLRRVDPRRAAEVHPNDTNKLMRAVEIFCLLQQPASSLKRTQEPLTGFRTLKIGIAPARELLYARIERRTRKMFADGLVGEARALLALGVPSTAKPFESLGYKEALAVVEGRLTEENAILQTAAETRRYVKRQLTWFRRDPEVEWFEGFGDDSGMQSNCACRVEEFLQLFD